jgi:NAD(P)-dependent dehydrogenase (short-subunit alcohol dehydrogenase family)
MTIRFDGRVAIVTGAGTGLGRSHALTLASRGANVVVNDLGGSLNGQGQSSSAADAVVGEIKAMGGKAVANYDSVADATGAEKIVASAVDAFGRLDILVNNAGILRDKTLAKMDPADYEAVTRVHLFGSAFCTRAALPAMQKNNYGRIIMTTSNAGLFGNFGQSNYGAAKAAVIGLMNVVRIEAAKYGILVNTIAPMAATRMTENVMPAEMLPLFKPEFVSAAVAYLASEQCNVSGYTVSASAGYVARVQVMSSPGVFFDTDRDLTPEMVADQWANITDMSKPQGFDSAGAEMEYIAKQTMARLKKSA